MHWQKLRSEIKKRLPSKLQKKFKGAHNIIYSAECYRVPPQRSVNQLYTRVKQQLANFATREKRLGMLVSTKWRCRIVCSWQ